jgi:hypothetical protein
VNNSGKLYKQFYLFDFRHDSYLFRKGKSGYLWLCKPNRLILMTKSGKNRFYDKLTADMTAISFEKHSHHRTP